MRSSRVSGINDTAIELRACQRMNVAKQRHHIGIDNRTNDPVCGVDFWAKPSEAIANTTKAATKSKKVLRGFGAWYSFRIESSPLIALASSHPSAQFTPEG